jgi:hypothetical protein
VCRTRQIALPRQISVTTSRPHRRLVLATGDVSLQPVDGSSVGEAGDGSLDLAAETLLRLVYGRLNDLDTAHTERVGLVSVRAVFPRF